MLTSRICSTIIVILGLFLLLAAHHHHHHASVRSYGGYPADHHTSAGVGDHKHLDNLILRRRKLMATNPHTSRSSSRNYRLRTLLSTSLEHKNQPPSLGTAKSSSPDGTSDDVTKRKEEISCSGGKHNHDQYELVPNRNRRRRRRLIAAGPSDSQPSPGYRP